MLSLLEKLKCFWLRLFFAIRYRKLEIAGEYLICPRCGKISVCPCKACRELRKAYKISGFKEYYVDIENGKVTCPYCNFSTDIEDWYFYDEECFHKKKLN